MDYGHGRNDITPSTCAAERPEYGGGDWHGRLVHLHRRVNVRDASTRPH